MFFVISNQQQCTYCNDLVACIKLCPGPQIFSSSSVRAANLSKLIPKAMQFLTLFVIFAAYGVQCIDPMPVEEDSLMQHMVENEGSGIRLYETVEDIISEQPETEGRYRRDTGDNTVTEATDKTTKAPATTITATTASPLTTVASQLGDNAVESESDSNKTCTIMTRCESNDECNGGTCVGFFPGKCNCNACLSFLPCKTDEQCGGLQGACNTTLSQCRCREALVELGYATILDSARDLCNRKSCKDNECHGLSCNKGFCACPAKKN